VRCEVTIDDHVGTATDLAAEASLRLFADEQCRIPVVDTCWSPSASGPAQVRSQSQCGGPAGSFAALRVPD
jgi:hypothetical protein